MNAKRAIFGDNTFAFGNDAGASFSIDKPHPLSFAAYLTQNEGAIFKIANSPSPERWFIPGAYGLTNGTPNEGKHLAFKAGMKRQVEKGEFYRVMALEDFAEPTIPLSWRSGALLISPRQAFLRVGGETAWAGFHRCAGDRVSEINEKFDWLVQPDETMKEDLGVWIANLDWNSLFGWLGSMEDQKFWSCVRSEPQFSVAEVQSAIQHLRVLLAASNAKGVKTIQSSVCLIGDHSDYLSGNSHIFPGSTLLQDEPRRAWSEMAFWLFDWSGAKFRPGLWKNAKRNHYDFTRCLPAKIEWPLHPPTAHEKIEALLHWEPLLKHASPPKEIQLHFDNLVASGQ